MTELFLAEPFLSLWAGRDPFAAAEALDGKVFRELDGRRTLRTEVAEHPYFVKTHRGVGWLEIFKNLLSLRLPIIGARNEWEAIRRLHELGVGTMVAVAYGTRGLNPAQRQSFLITEELSSTINLEDFCRDWKNQPPLAKIKHALIGKVAELARKMHGGGVNHRDFYLCHLRLSLPIPPDTEDLKLSVLDLHRAHIRAEVPRRWRDKDLAALHFSSLEIGLTRRDRLRFLRAYFARPLRAILRDEQDLLAFLAREGLRLQERFQRKFA